MTTCHFLIIISMPIRSFDTRRTLSCRIVRLTFNFDEVWSLLNHLLFMLSNLILFHWAHFLVVVNSWRRTRQRCTALLALSCYLFMLNVVVHLFTRTLHRIHLGLSVILILIGHWVIDACKVCIFDGDILIFVDELDWLLLLRVDGMHLSSVLNHLLFLSLLTRCLLLCSDSHLRLSPSLVSLLIYQGIMRYSAHLITRWQSMAHVLCLHACLSREILATQLSHIFLRTVWQWHLVELPPGIRNDRVVVATLVSTLVAASFVCVTRFGLH